MKKANVYVDVESSSLIVSKAFHKRACMFGTSEYYELRQAKLENAEFSIKIKTCEKRTYHGLSFDTMAEYIKIHPKSEERLLEFEAVKRVAEIKGSKYPLTKKWFLMTYPEYKENEVSKDEQDAALSNMKGMAKTDIEKKISEVDRLANQDAA